MGRRLSRKLGDVACGMLLYYVTAGGYAGSGNFGDSYVECVLPRNVVLTRAVIFLLFINTTCKIRLLGGGRVGVLRDLISCSPGKNDFENLQRMES